jgi:hypothetical protein
LVTKEQNKNKKVSNQAQEEDKQQSSSWNKNKKIRAPEGKNKMVYSAAQHLKETTINLMVSKHQIKA